jgi:hypothetical protein
VQGVPHHRPDRVAVDGCGLSHDLHAFAQIPEQRIDIMDGPMVDGDVQIARRQRRGELALDVSAAFAHLISQLVDVDRIGLERE